MGIAIVTWLTEALGPEAGKIIGVFIISMLPVIELRGAIPVAFALGLDWRTAFICAVVGNLLPIPFILLFLNTVFNFMKAHGILVGMVEWFERKAMAKNADVSRYEFWGLALFVAIPLPGTGGWTGSLVASVMKMNRVSAIVSIFIGVVVAGVAVTAATYGLVGAFFK